MSTGAEPQQPTSDYTHGYALGARAATRSPGLNDAMLLAKALLAYGRASRAAVLNKEQFMHGYMIAYAHFTRKEQ